MDEPRHGARRRSPPDYFSDDLDGKPDARKIELYLTQYLPFHEQFAGIDPRELDRAAVGVREIPETVVFSGKRDMKIVLACASYGSSKRHAKPVRRGGEPFGESAAVSCVWRITDFPKNQQFATHRHTDEVIEALKAVA
jgi:hypothetical protein